MGEGKNTGETEEKKYKIPLRNEAGVSLSHTHCP